MKAFTIKGLTEQLNMKRWTSFDEIKTVFATNAESVTCARLDESTFVINVLSIKKNKEYLNTFVVKPEFMESDCTMLKNNNTHVFVSTKTNLELVVSNYVNGEVYLFPDLKMQKEFCRWLHSIDDGRHHISLIKRNEYTSKVHSLITGDFQMVNSLFEDIDDEEFPFLKSFDSELYAYVTMTELSRKKVLQQFRATLHIFEPFITILAKSEDGIIQSYSMTEYFESESALNVSDFAMVIGTGEDLVPLTDELFSELFIIYLYLNDDFNENSFKATFYLDISLD